VCVCVCVLLSLSAYLGSSDFVECIPSVVPSSYDKFSRAGYIEVLVERV
jgi:hypothetical protein